MPLREFKAEFGPAVRAVRNAVANGRTAHAYLLHCDNALLADGFSTALAQLLSCQSRPKNGDACGRCDICAQIAKGNYPELFTIAPTSKSRRIKIGEDETEHDSIRWFQSLFYFAAAYASGKKIGIIKDADRMMPQAQNAFLKTLEEPPQNSYFIICSANPSELLPTFRSRCQRIAILRNSQKYDLDEKDEILSLLDSIAGDNDFSAAEKSASEMISLFGTLKQKAEAKVAAQWERLIENKKNLESNARNSLDERLEAAIQAEYLLSREKIISLIHSYFAQIYQLSCGIAPDCLPNQELISQQRPETDEKNALNQLRKAEAFLLTMKLNVDESLAIRAFCHSIAFR